jgi:predicted nucleic acid-binding protein
MIVVSDTSPINYLIIIGEIELLPALFGVVVIPDAVDTELRAPGSPSSVKSWMNTGPSWIDVKASRTVDTTLTLGRGEVEAISLAKELDADLVLIDDRKARIAALDRGLKVAGTINILEVASKRGLITLTDSFRKLVETNFRISPALLAEVLKRNT